MQIAADALEVGVAAAFGGRRERSATFRPRTVDGDGGDRERVCDRFDRAGGICVEVVAREGPAMDADYKRYTSSITVGRQR